MNDDVNDKAPRPPAAPDEVAPVRAIAGDGASPQEATPGAIDVHAYIGRQLRAAFDDVAKQPIPERFLDLMRQLEGSKPGG